MAHAMWSQRDAYVRQPRSPEAFLALQRHEARPGTLLLEVIAGGDAGNARADDQNLEMFRLRRRGSGDCRGIVHRSGLLLRLSRHRVHRRAAAPHLPTAAPRARRQRARTPGGSRRMGLRRRLLASSLPPVQVSSLIEINEGGISRPRPKRIDPPPPNPSLPRCLKATATAPRAARASTASPRPSTPYILPP